MTMEYSKNLEIFRNDNNKLRSEIQKLLARNYTRGGDLGISTIEQENTKPLLTDNESCFSPISPRDCIKNIYSKLRNNSKEST
jgi:hypothetical protein